MVGLASVEKMILAIGIPPVSFILTAKCNHDTNVWRILEVKHEYKKLKDRYLHILLYYYVSSSSRGWGACIVLIQYLACHCNASLPF